MFTNEDVAYGNTTLPKGVRSGYAENVNGLTVHFLEAGFEEKDRPCVLLLHGFPEMAYCWRKQLLPLANAGFHVVAPDQRGYGRTTGWDADYDGDVGSFRLYNLVKDALTLVFALGHRSVAAVVGHDFGAPVAAYCSLIRPDVFRSLVLLSSPFAGVPSLPFNTGRKPAVNTSSRKTDVYADLAELDIPRKHYQQYYSSPQANSDMLNCPQGLKGFFRAYFHVKSADWLGNKPHQLTSWSAAELEKLPRYYVMDLDKTMPETVAPAMPSLIPSEDCAWLNDAELSVYCEEYQKNGFQGGLQWYRCSNNPRYVSDLKMFSGRTVDVPSYYIGGASDWGTHQAPGAFESMQASSCTHMIGAIFVEGAGHWVQQEQPTTTNSLLIKFLRKNS
jgi:pimeloyl-ACP methyl ester carboxylesterase